MRDLLFEALRRHDVDDENHRILKPPNVAAWYQAVLDFLTRKVSGS